MASKVIALRKATYNYPRPSIRLVSDSRLTNLNSTDIVDPEWDEMDPDDCLTGVGLDHLYQGNGSPLYIQG